MTAQSEVDIRHGFADLAFGGGTPRKAILTAIVVGTVLTPPSTTATLSSRVPYPRFGRSG
jgi:hypothetical protein